MQWLDSAITLSRNISLHNSLARHDCINSCPRTSDEHCPQWSLPIAISTRLHEPTTLTRISRAQRIAQLICGGFITSSRARTNRVTLIRSSRELAMQRPSPTASPAPSMAMSSIGGLWSRVCKEKSACLYKIGAQIFLINLLQKSKTISNFVERNPKKRQQETDIFLDNFSDPNRDSLTGFLYII